MFHKAKVIYSDGVRSDVHGDRAPWLQHIIPNLKGLKFGWRRFDKLKSWRRRVPAPHECSNPLANTTRVRTETVLLYLNPFKPFKNWYNKTGQLHRNQKLAASSYFFPKLIQQIG
ncbi:MAG: hypothetical protein ACI91V_000898 [Lentimonas sp.]|jgi:hypothetical protein